MHKRLSSRHNRMTLSPARPVHRTSIRALRHHAARTRALDTRRSATNGSHERSGGLLRSWLRAVLSALRIGTRARRVQLRRLLRRATIRRSTLARAKRSATASGNRLPRRLSASTGWFTFGSR